MSDDTTITNAPEAEGVDADNVTAPAQPETTEPAKAVQETEAEPTNTNDKQPEDLVEWAQKKGLPLSAEPTDNELKLAKMQREADRKISETSQAASELKGVINEEAKAQPVPEDDNVAAMQQQLQVLQANQAVNDFYASNPDARNYDAAMAKIVRENPNVAAGGIEALYAMAKVRDLQSGGEDNIKDEGKKEALQDLALKQKVAATTGAATTKQTSAGGVTREDVQRALADHDVSWLKKHQAEIDAL